MAERKGIAGPSRRQENPQVPMTMARLSKSKSRRNETGKLLSLPFQHCPVFQLLHLSILLLAPWQKAWYETKKCLSLAYLRYADE